MNRPLLLSNTPCLEQPGLFAMRNSQAEELEVRNSLKMLPVLTAHGQIVGKRRGGNEQVNIADLLPGHAESGILLAPDSGNGVVNAQHRDLTDDPPDFPLRLRLVGGTRYPAVELGERHDTHCQSVRLPLADGLHELGVTAEVFDQPGAIEEVQQMPP